MCKVLIMWQILPNVITMKRMDRSEDTPTSTKKTQTDAQNSFHHLKASD